MEGHTLRICSALTSHLALPSFSLIESRSRRTCAIDIFTKDDTPPIEALDGCVEDLSKVYEVGDPRLLDNAGEYLPPLATTAPPLTPAPPPPNGGLVALLLDSSCERGVIVLERGEVIECRVCAVVCS